MKKRIIGLLLALVMVLSLVPTMAFAATKVASGYCGGDTSYGYDEGGYKNLSWTLDDQGTLTVSGAGAMEEYDWSSDAPWYSYRSSITSVVIGNGVTSIGNYVFSGYSSLTGVTISGSVTSIGVNAFSGCGLTGVTIPSGVTSIGYGAFEECSSLTEIEVAADNADYCSVDGILYSKEKDILIYCPDGKAGSVTIPGSVTSIGASAFEDCSSLTGVTIPNSVTNIGFWAFLNCNSLTGVTIPDSVTSIGDSAFKDCSSLTDVTIPISVTSIGMYAFFGCTSLTDVYYNGAEAQWNAISIGNHNDCLTGATIHFAESHTQQEIASGTCGANLTWTLDDQGTLTVSGTGAMEDYDSSAPWYSYRSSITSVVIGNSVTSIGSYAFLGCSSLAGVTIPSSVTSIGERAFYDCSSLTDVTIPDSVTDIGGWAFAGTPWLTNLGDFAIANGILLEYNGSAAEVVIPNSVTSIGDLAFGYHNVTSVTIPGSVTSIGREAFHACERLTDVSIPDSVTSIEFGAFWACSSLTSVTIPDSVTAISGYAFFVCTNLTDITIPGGVTSIGEWAFLGCDSLTDVYYDATEAQWNAISIGNHNDCLTGATIHFAESHTQQEVASGTCGDNLTWTLDSAGTLTVSGAGAMYDVFWNGDEAPWYSYCSSITSVVIGNGVTTIGDWAFSYCSSLTGVTIPNSVTSIGYGAFEECSSLAGVTIPDSVTSIEGGAFYGCSSLTGVTIPFGVTSIGPSAFAFCSSLQAITVDAANANYCSVDGILYNKAKTELIRCPQGKSGHVTIPGTVTSIENDAFMGCSGLTGVTIPGSVKSLGIQAFSGCSSLESVVIPSGVTHIGWWAFCNCTSLKSVTIPGSVEGIGAMAFSGCRSLKSITIPDSVTDIGEDAFSDCSSLTSVKIGKGVAGIGQYAFYGCDSLTDVHYAGTKSQWQKITIGSGNDDLTGATIHYTETKPAAPTVKISTNASSGKPTLTWAKVTGASKYYVYRATSKSGTYTKMATTTSTSYTNTSAKPGTTYYYKVKAVTSAGTTGEFSAVKSITCDCAAPVVKISTSSTSGKPVLSWSKVEGATSYVIYRAAGKTGKYTALKTITSTSYTDSTAKPGTTYYYKVKALCSKSSYAESAFSAIKSITCDCAAPVVTITTSSGKPKLTWKKVDGATSYAVYRATSKTGTYTKLTTTTSTTCTNKSAKKGTTYYYKVKALCSKSSNATSAFSSVKSIRATK